MKYCFGVDIGGTTVKIGLFEMDGKMIGKWGIPTRTEDNGKNILGDIVQVLNEKMDEYDIVKSEVEGIGMGIPAPVDVNGVVLNTVNLGWGYKAVKREMEDLTGLKVQAANDANVAALGEMWQGAGKGETDVVMITLGTGVGGGIICDGRPIIGTNGAAGEIGHICVSHEETETCNCGKKGCLEQYASATGIVRIANIRLSVDDKPSILRNEEISAKTVFDAVKEGDELAKDIAEEFGYYMGRATSMIAAVVDPAIFVIGGGVSNAGPVLLDYIQKYYQTYAFFANQHAKFALAELGNDAGIIGGAKLMLDNI